MIHLGATFLHLHQQIGGHGVIVTVGDLYDLIGLEGDMNRIKERLTAAFTHNVSGSVWDGTIL